MTRWVEVAHPLYFCEFSRDAEDWNEFSFTVGRDAEIQAPSFIVLISRENSTVRLAKVRRIRKVATLDTALDLYDVCRAHIDRDRVARWAAREQIPLPTSEQPVTAMTKLYFSIRDELLLSNPELTRDYFEFHAYSPDSVIPVQLGDAVATGLRIFERTAPLNGHYKGLQEQEIFDLDIQSFFDGPVRCDPLGRYHYEKGDRLLLIHKVDRKQLEKCIGVDLVYNNVDEQRCVFIQYKCQGHNGKPYYCNSDKTLLREVDRMQQIPGLQECRNLASSLADARLCGCSVFLKLCRREVPIHHKVPRGAYFPLCVWRHLMDKYKGAGIDVDVRPHLTNDMFSEAFHAGLIGTTPRQTQELQDYLDPAGRDDRVRLVFEERRLTPPDVSPRTPVGMDTKSNRHARRAPNSPVNDAVETRNDGILSVADQDDDGPRPTPSPRRARGRTA